MVESLENGVGNILDIETIPKFPVYPAVLFGEREPHLLSENLSTGPFVNMIDPNVSIGDDLRQLFPIE